MKGSMGYVSYRGFCDLCDWSAKYGSVSGVRKSFDGHTTHIPHSGTPSMGIEKWAKGKVVKGWSLANWKPRKRHKHLKPTDPDKPKRVYRKTHHQADPAGLNFCPCCGANINVILTAMRVAGRMG